MNDWTNIRISKELHNELLRRGNKCETFDCIIKRLIGEEKNIAEIPNAGV
jgi:hypothetical protein